MLNSYEDFASNEELTYVRFKKMIRRELTYPTSRMTPCAVKYII